MAQASAALEHELTSPPTDGITNVVFANHSDLLLVSSWDKGVRLYDVKKTNFDKDTSTRLRSLMSPSLATTASASVVVSTKISL